MAAEPPHPPAPITLSPDQERALDGLWAVLDAGEGDFRRLHDLWPDVDSAESQALRSRLRARVAPGGALAQAEAALGAAFGGPIPEAMRHWLRAEVERLAFSAPGGWIIQQARYGTGPLAHASRRLLEVAGRPRAPERAASAPAPPPPDARLKQAHEFTDEELRRLPRYRRFKRPRA